MEKRKHIHNHCGKLLCVHSVREIRLFRLKSFVTISIDPGSAGEDKGGIHRLISATVTMCGIFIISTLIGALTTGMEGKLAELRKGRTKVVESNHTSTDI